MKAILLAAGIGSRISREINTPKSMLQINNTTIIGNTVKMLFDNNIEVAVVVGYKKDCILDSFKDIPITYYYNPFFRVTNSIGSLWFAKDFIDENDDIILANADVFWEKPILNALINDDREIVMLGDKSRIDTGDYFLKIKDDKIVSYGKELSLKERSSEYVGIAKIRKSFLPIFKKNLDDLINAEKYNLWWENVLYENINDYPVYVKDISEYFWSEVDYIEDYKRILHYTNTKKN